MIRSSTLFDATLEVVVVTQGNSDIGARRQKDPADWLDVDEGHQRSGLNSILFFIFPMIVLAAIISALAALVK